jgi:RNA ligase (TIGR02306 family)
MRKLATIQKIAEIRPIEGADTIEAVRINGWWCVAKKGEFKQDDLCCFFEVDSLLPSNNPLFDFLSKGNKEKVMFVDGLSYRGWRLKTIRLKGQLSQGLALPVSSFTQSFGFEFSTEGTDVSELLSIVKYEPPIPAQLAGKVKGNFPGFLRKTDEERVQNLVNELESFQAHKFYVTEKLDGTSATFYNKDGHFGVCSRNLDLTETDGNTHWQIAKRYHLDEILPDNYCIQGEIVGEGIQGNPLKLKGQDLYIFNVYRIDIGEYIGLEKMEEVCSTLGIKTVPVISRDFNPILDIAYLLRVATNKSILCDTAMREGLVYRQMTGGVQPISFKVISNEYLLKHDQ